MHVLSILCNILSGGIKGTNCVTNVMYPLLVLFLAKTCNTCRPKHASKQMERLKKFIQQTIEKYRERKTRKIRSLLNNTEVLKNKKKRRCHKKKHRVDHNKEQQGT